MAGKKYSKNIKPKTAPGLESSHGPLSADSSVSGNPTVLAPNRKSKKAK